MSQSEKATILLPQSDDPNTHTTTSCKQQKYQKYFFLATCSAYLALDVVASYLDHTINNNQNLLSLFLMDYIFFVGLVVYAMGERTPQTHRLLSRYAFYFGWMLPLLTVLGPYAVDWAMGRNPSLSFEYGSLGEQVGYCHDEPYTSERHGKLFDRAIARSRELGLPIMTTVTSCGTMAFPKSKVMVHLLYLGFAAVQVIAYWSKAREKVPFP
ncbi:hypothetical protein BG005_002238 [Podila minutissima]|nr:hypothetical protein BG005_002238 [Podila minutissima]